MVASRNINAGETVLEDTPVLILPHETTNAILFMTLPQKALEAILLLHNEKPNARKWSVSQDIPIHRLMDFLQGTLDTNCFSTYTPDCQIGALLLAGSLFNHSDTPNLSRGWDNKSDKLIFTASRDVKEGEELLVDYVPTMKGVEKAEHLKTAYGIH